MPFEIIRNDIANVQADAIVTAASAKARISPGVDAAVHIKAGPALLSARAKAGQIPVGDAVITPAFDLPANYVVHAPNPIWVDGSKGEEDMLYQVYLRCLDLAYNNGCDTVAFPLLGAGNHGFPPQVALQVAVRAFGAFLMRRDMHIFLVVYQKESVVLSQKLVQDVKSYIDDRYVQQHMAHPTANLYEKRLRSALIEEMSVSENGSLDDFLRRQDTGFVQMLKDLIQKSGLKNAQVYKQANIDKKLFSKIINNPSYHPSKQTALAFAIALRLDLPTTQSLIGRAGYTLTHSSKFDLIIEYFITRGQYDIFTINEVLFDFDQMLLGY